MHNSMNSLDWGGVYQGVVPCADCEGIDTTITLDYDLTYEIQKIYKGKDESAFVNSGTFSWNDDGSTITLNNIRDGEAARHYKVGENILFQLDPEGNMITGDLADHHTLEKISD